MSDMEVEVPSLQQADFPSSSCSPGLQSPEVFGDGSCSDCSSGSDGGHSKGAGVAGDQPASPSTPSLSPHNPAFSSSNQFLNFSYKNLGVLAETNLEALRAEFGQQSPETEPDPPWNNARTLQSDA